MEAAQRAANERDRWLTRDELIEFRDARVRLLKAVDDCSAHRVDWRARARAAEERVLKRRLAQAEAQRFLEEHNDRWSK